MKRFLALILCLTMALGLCACGSHDAQSSALTEIETVAQIRKDAILSAETAIVQSDTFIKGETYTGTAYYVSNSGSDGNNGRSPESAFATMQAFDHVTLRYGDAVFFERGGLWRQAELHHAIRGAGGVTISAYGEGEKPRFYGSVENGSGEGKWELAYETEDGRKIWRYYQDMTEVAGIVLDGKTIVNRDIAFWDGAQYWTLMPGYIKYTITETPYDVQTQLKDMWCFPQLAYEEGTNDSVFRNWVGDNYRYATGPLYFRCDAGDPGALYESIEFMQPCAFMSDCQDDTVLDNLCLAYSSETVGSGKDDNGPNNGLVIQNCELGWFGGNVHRYAEETGGAQQNDVPFDRFGYCISVSGSGTTLRNNYIHHVYQAGIGMTDSAITDTTITGNLITHCGQGIAMQGYEDQVREENMLRNVTIEDNQVLYTAYETQFRSDWEVTLTSGAVTVEGAGFVHDGTLLVKNNVFYLAAGPLVEIYNCDSYLPVFEDNTYGQTAGAVGILLQGDEVFEQLKLKGSGKNNVVTALGDKTAEIITVS